MFVIVLFLCPNSICDLPLTLPLTCLVRSLPPFLPLKQQLWQERLRDSPLDHRLGFSCLHDTTPLFCLVLPPLSCLSAFTDPRGPTTFLLNTPPVIYPALTLFSCPCLSSSSLFVFFLHFRSLLVTLPWFACHSWPSSRVFSKNGLIQTGVFL